MKRSRFPIHGWQLMLIVCAPLALGCASSPPASTPPADEREPYRLESEGQVGLDESSIRREIDRIDEFEETAISGGDVPVQDVEPVEELDVSDVPADTTLQSAPGYRVQIFASGSRTSAEAVRQAVTEVMGVAAYVEKIDGIYKVRVGDCRSRPEAEDLLQRCRQVGYGDAWIVSSAVVFKRPER